MQRRPLSDRQGGQACATIDLVAPLGPNPPPSAVTDIAGRPTVRSASGAVTGLIGESLRHGDVDSANFSTRPTATTPGARTSTTATRTTGTRTTTTGSASSADHCAAVSGDGAPFSFPELVRAYFDCREHKRNTLAALAFEADLERNLRQLYAELLDGTYRIGRSICFVITRPKPREVWAADFRDRIVHHLLYNRVAPRFYASFIADTCACIPGRGTLYAARRLEHQVRSITHNWQHPAYYLKCDLANFFVSIDKRIARDLLAQRVHEPWWLTLAEQILFHDPKGDVDVRGHHARLALIPPYKSLFNQPAHLGLPIGNLSSQFFANVYLDVLDQFVKHRIGCRHYVRYVDDFVLLHESARWLNDAKAAIESLLRDRLALRLNAGKTILQPIDRGIDFAGHVVRPWCRRIRRRTAHSGLTRLGQLPADRFFESANSYLGLFRQATHSHHDRARFGRLALLRGRCVDLALTKTYRSADAGR